MEEAEDAQSILDVNKYDVRILSDEIGSFFARFYRAAYLKSPSVNPNHDRLFYGSVICLPYIQIQAVFASRIKGSPLPFVINLTGTLRIVISLVYAIVGNNVNRSFPAMFAYRLFAHEWDTLIGDDIIGLSTDEGAVDALHGQRLVVIAVGNFPVLAVQGLQLRPFLSKRIVLRNRVIGGVGA